MDEILKVLTLYDITAYLLPGVVVVGAIVRAAKFAGWQSAPEWSWKLVVAAYIVGQLLQAIASDKRVWSGHPVHLQKLEQVFPDKPDDRTEFRRDLTNAIDITFKCPPESDRFFLCETYLQARKLDSFTVIMQARYGFFRGLFLSFSMAVIAFVVAFVWVLIKPPDLVEGRRRIGPVVLLLAACGVGAWLSWERKMDFDRYYAQGTYRAFYVHYLHEQTSGNSPCDNVQ